VHRLAQEHAGEQPCAGDSDLAAQVNLGIRQRAGRGLLTRRQYCQQYGLTPKQVILLGVTRLDRMTELGRELITLFARHERAGKRRYNTEREP
jgi:hypothetical protein